MFIISNIGHIGKRIKEARLKKKFTQQELADKCGLTKSLISKIEHGQTASAIATLSKITKELEVSLSWVLGEDKEENLIISPSKSRTSKVGNKEMGYLYETLANRPQLSKIEPIIATVLPDSSEEGPYTHLEDEFILVLSGSIYLSYDGENYLLEEGDSAYFNGTVPHVFLPVDRKEAKVLSIFIEPSSI
ncbi:helix-turn-helix domain-containing protein [Neobacillus vireti]|uniref:helix-turn-helix domain-containing protein n=1 Tax=Neobacillus vireti TaxID=220686 RepID=UPI003000F9FE